MVQDVVLFEGIDAGNRTGLWVTNGTAAGTFELTTSGGPPPSYPGSPITGEAPYGFLPIPAVSLDLTVFNNQVLFVGRYGQNNYGLWTTDGTGAGTVQLANISGANAAGIFTQAISPDFTVYNGEVLFNGVNNAATALHSLWTTNGTVAGTHEVTGINRALATGNNAGVNPTDMTVFGNEVLFNGVDTAGHQGLWVTNGTGAGTQELTVGATASATGIDPTDMTVLNDMVLFNGVDANGPLRALGVERNQRNGARRGRRHLEHEGPEPDRHDGLRQRSAVQWPRSEWRPAVVGDKRDVRRHISTHGRRRRERFCECVGYRSERPHGLQRRGPFQRP